MQPLFFDLITQRMIQEAENLGADAIVNVRFASSAIMQGAAEIMAYGTAVKIKEQSKKLDFFRTNRYNRTNNLFHSQEVLFMRRKMIAICLSAAVVLSAIAPNAIADAAAKPKLKTKKLTILVNQKKSIKVTKQGKYKLSYASKNKKVAAVSSKGQVTGKKKGSTKITVFYKKGKAAKKKLGTVRVVVNKNKKDTAPQTTPGASQAPVITQAPVATQAPTATPLVSQTPATTPLVSQAPATEVPATATPDITTTPTRLATVDYPSLYSDIPDLDIIRCGENYYMVSTTMNMCPGVPIMKSTDLAHWQIVNYVYDTFADDDFTNMNNNKDMYKHGSWAASLKYNEADNKFYVAFNSNDHGFYVYTTDDIEKGTWTKHFTKTKFHDPALLFDEEKMYVISGGSLQQLELDGDAVKTVGSSVKLFDRNKMAQKTGNKWTLWEGAHAYKIGEYYYLFIIASPEGQWMRTEVCYRSKTLGAGDWEEQIIYQGGCGGYGAGLAQGGIVETQFGDWYGFLFQDHGGVGRIPSIVGVNWDYTDDEGNNYKDWPMLGSYDEDGNFTPSKAEGTATINLPDSGLDNYFVGDDDFTYKEGDKLKLVWQWNHNPQNNFWSLTDNPGHLRITTDRVVNNVMRAHNSLTQRTYGPTCTSETKISIAGMKPGDYAGLASVADLPGMIGVLCDENGDKYIAQASAKLPSKTEETTTFNEKTTTPLDANEVFLKIAYDFKTDNANFFYSLDGEEWTKLGKTQKLGFSTSTTFMGTRTWLFNYATLEEGGYVDFDYYKIYD